MNKEAVSIFHFVYFTALSAKVPECQTPEFSHKLFSLTYCLSRWEAELQVQQHRPRPRRGGRLLQLRVPPGGEVDDKENSAGKLNILFQVANLLRLFRIPQISPASTAKVSCVFLLRKRNSQAGIAFCSKLNREILSKLNYNDDEQINRTWKMNKFRWFRRYQTRRGLSCLRALCLQTLSR